MDSQRSPANTADLSLRPIGPDDTEFLRRLYAGTREYELSISGLGEKQKKAFIEMQFSAQDTHYRSQFPDAQFSLILLGSAPIGRLLVDRRAEAVRILDITIDAEYKNQGLGTHLVEQLMAEAGEAGKPVSIYVDNDSPACCLFRRLGFVAGSDDGVRSLWAWKPNA